MSKNLIDKDSFELIEGTEKTTFDALEQRVTDAETDIAALEGGRVEAGQTVQPIAVSLPTEQTISADAVRLVLLPEPIIVANYTAIEVELQILGAELSDPASTANAMNIYFRGEDGDGNAVNFMGYAIKQTSDAYKDVTVYGVFKSDGYSRVTIDGYQYGSIERTSNIGLPSGQTFPAKITQVGVYLSSIPSLPLKTFGIIETIRGVR